MKTSMRMLQVAGVGVFLLGVAAVVVLVAPEVQGQVDRPRPLQITSQIFGGSAIGVRLREVDEADVSREGLSSASGAVVEEVRSDSPAAEAGFRAGDVVIAFDGERVRSARHLARLIEDTPDGRSVAATVMRAGEQRELSVAPEANAAFSLAPLRELRGLSYAIPDNFEIPEVTIPDFEMPEIDVPELRNLTTNYSYILGSRTRARLGATASNLTEQLGEYFGAEDGVLIASVDEDTPAARAGLKAGDVITRVAGEAIGSTSELQRRIRAAEGEITIDIVRDREAQTLRVDLGERETGRTVRRIVR